MDLFLQHGITFRAKFQKYEMEDVAIGRNLIVYDIAHSYQISTNRSKAMVQQTDRHYGETNERKNTNFVKSRRKNTVSRSCRAFSY
jgi:hypothetical protein